MKIYDRVKLISTNKEYLKQGIKIGDIGRINIAEIRDGYFHVAFDTEDEYDWYKFCAVKIADLELVEDGFADDKTILKELPKNDPRWWCKVENGFILNLLGEKKNKIPYDYNS